MKLTSEQERVLLDLAIVADVEPDGMARIADVVGARKETVAALVDAGLIALRGGYAHAVMTPAGLHEVARRS